ncbi:OmpP1/FadL family transporter [Planctomycetota bacterium]
MVREDPHNERTKLLLDKRTLTLIFVVFASFTNGVYAQSIMPSPIPITPEPVGSGARALGQSAFIAVADDATAASWNPAGLTNLERQELSFVYAWRNITKDYSDSVLFDQDSWRDSQINFMSYAQPLDVGVISVNYHQVYDFGVEVHASDPGGAFNHYAKSEGAIAAYSLAGGLIFSPGISIGAGFNWYTQSLHNDYAWQVQSMTTLDAVVTKTETNTLETFDDFRGYNFTLGLLWDAYEKHSNLLTLGLVYHTPFTAKVDWDFVATKTETTTTFVPPLPVVTVETLSFFLAHGMEIDFPASIGAGANYRITDRLNVAFDIEWKEWSKFKQKYPNGQTISPTDDDALAYRLGGEHLILSDAASESVLACRGGAFYEPRPIADDPDLLPVYGLSAGLGWTMKERFSLDFAYQYRWAEQDLEEIDYDYKEHLFLTSLILYF